MEKFQPNLEANNNSAEGSPEVLALLEQVKETISGFRNVFGLKVKKLLQGVLDFMEALAGFKIEFIDFGQGMKTVAAYDQNGVDYPIVNNFLNTVLL